MYNTITLNSSEAQLEIRMKGKDGYLILGRAGDTPENREIALRALAEIEAKKPEDIIQGTTFKVREAFTDNSVLGQVVLLRSQFGDPTASKERTEEA